MADGKKYSRSFWTKYVQEYGISDIVGYLCQFDVHGMLTGAMTFLYFPAQRTRSSSHQVTDTATLQKSRFLKTIGQTSLPSTKRYFGGSG